MSPPTTTDAMTATLAFSACVSSARAKRLCDKPLSSPSPPPMLHTMPAVSSTALVDSGFPQSELTEEAA